MSTASIAAAIDRTRSRRARTTKTATTGSTVAYLRVSTDDQAESGAGLAAQRNAIEAVAAVRGWTITAWHEDGGVRECLRTRDGRACASRRTEEVGSWLGR